MALRMKKLAILSLITCLAPAVAFSQSCTVAQVSQEFSYEDTFNSSGSALGDAYAVFQQDRFYVNQQGRLDPNDKPDPIMVNREARANYGQAIRAYMNANGMGDMPAQVLVGSQYTVEIEACGSQDNPSIRVLSMRMGGDIEDDSWELELEYREAELADWEQRLNQREADLNQWERQLGDWERRLSDMEYNLSQPQQTPVSPTGDKNPAGPSEPATSSSIPASGSNFASDFVQTEWTLFDDNLSCGTGQARSFQRFTPQGYLQMINGDDTSSNDLRVNYFNVDEQLRTFQAEYVYYNPSLTVHATAVTTYNGTVNSDGSLSLTSNIQIIDFDTINSARPVYTTTQEGGTYWSCDDVEQANDALVESAFNDGNYDRVLISGVPADMLSQATQSCDVALSQAVNTSDNLVLQVFTSRYGQWSETIYGTDACRQSDNPNLCASGESEETITVIQNDPLTLQSRSVSGDCISIDEFRLDNGGGQHIATYPESICPSLYRLLPDPITKNVIECN